MSKNTTIREGQVGRAFGGVAKLKADLTGGGACLWVPKDERELEPLDVTANGTYRPTKYGFSRANVRVPSQSGGVTGKGQDGNEYTVTVDDGDLVKTKIPSAIHITTEPTKTAYADGETINFSGLVVKAYDGEGNLYDVTGYAGGVVPNAELQFPVTTAVYTGGGGAYYDAYVSPSGNIQVGTGTITGPIIAIDRLILTSPSVNPHSLLTEAFLIPRSKWWYCILVVYTGGEITVRYAVVDGKMLVASSNNFNCQQHHILEDGTVIGAGSLPVTQSFTLEQKTVYYKIIDPTHFQETDFSFMVPESIDASGEVKRICWYMLYGDMQYQGDSEQEIPVNWPRPGDGAILSDEFTIVVSPAAAQSDESGGSGAGSGSGGSGEGGGGGGHSF